MPALPTFGFYPSTSAVGLSLPTRDTTGRSPVVAWRYSDGRSSPLDPMGAPTLEVTLDNSDNRFNLDTAAPLIFPGCIASMDHLVYTSFSPVAPSIGGPNGYAGTFFIVDRVDASHGRGRDSSIVVTCSSGLAHTREATIQAGASWAGPADPLAFLQNTKLATPNAAIAGLTGDALSEPTIIAGGTFNQDNFWDVAASVAKAFGAVLYPYGGIAVGGQIYPYLRYVSRRARATNGAANWAAYPVEIGDADSAMPVEGGDIILSFDADLVRNTVTFETTLLPAATATGTDAASIARFGVREETLQGPWTGANATLAATRLIERYAQPTLSVPPITVNLDYAPYNMAAAVFADPYWAEALVGVRAILPNGQETYVGCLLEGRDVSGAAGQSTLATLTLTPCARDGFALYDTAVGGGYDTGRMGL